MKVLLLIDIQNDFCPGGNLAVTDGDQVVSVANELTNSGEFDLVVASKDWHPADHKSFASNNGKNVYDMIKLQGLDQVMWPDHCVQGSPGSEFHPDLDVNGIDHIIYKGTDPEIDSYSAFFDNGKLKETELRAYLEQQAGERGEDASGIEVTVCGLATDFCVAFTARDAKELGYDTTIAVDGCRAVNLNPGDDVRVLRELAGLGITVSESREILGRERTVNRPVARSQERGQELHP